MKEKKRYDGTGSCDDTDSMRRGKCRNHSGTILRIGDTGRGKDRGKDRS